MKNVKLLIATSLASTLLLASCCKHTDYDMNHICDECGETISKCVDANKDHSCDICFGEVGEHADKSGDGNCDYCGLGMPRVNSISIAGTPDELVIGKTATLTANVNVSNGAKKTVTWSSSNNGVASVSANGVVTGVAEGTVTITATSTVDTTKSSSVTITVVNPHWSIEDADLIESVLGETISYIGDGWDPVELSPLTDTLNGAVTYSETASIDSVVTILESDGFEVIISDEEGYYLEKLSDDYSYTICVELYDWTSDEGYSVFFTYRIDAETSWPGDILLEYLPAYMDWEAEELLPIEADYYYVSGQEGTVLMQIYGAEITVNEYYASLEQAGWTYDEDSEIYFSPNNTLVIMAEIEGECFYLLAAPTLPELEEVPQNWVDAFVSETLESMFTITAPSFESAEFYTYEEAVIDIGDLFFGIPGLFFYYYADIYAYGDFETSEYLTYVNDLKDLGFEVVEENEENGSYDSELVLGFIDVYLTYIPADEESFGVIDVTISLSDVEEESRLLALLEEPVLALGEKVNLVTKVLQAEGTFEFESSDDEVVTVSNTGEVEAVGLGEATITVTLTISEEEVYTTEIDVEVLPETTGVKVDVENTINMCQKLELEYSYLPENSKYLGEDEISYEIVSGSEYASIEDGVLIPNKETITEDVVVGVKAILGTFESEIFEITIEYVDPTQKETITFASATSVKYTTSLGIKFNASKGSGSSDPIIGADGTYRVYAGNTLTITAPTGCVITELVFTLNNSGKTPCTVSCDTGSFNESTLTWTGNASSVTFTMANVSKTQFRISSVEATIYGYPEISDVEESDIEPLMLEQLYLIFGEEATSDDYQVLENGALYCGIVWGDAADYSSLDEALDEYLENYLLDGFIYCFTGDGDDSYYDYDTFEDGTEYAMVGLLNEDYVVIEAYVYYENYDGDDIVGFDLVMYQSSPEYFE